MRGGRVSLEGNSKLVWKELGNRAASLLELVGVSVLLRMSLARRVHRKFSDQILDLAGAANAISDSVS